MEVFLAKLTQQAMNYAIRSGITITATYAIRQSSRLLKNVSGTERQELLALQQRLQSKIQVISPAIDMIELIAARGNTSLESAVTLTKSLRWDIQALGQRLAKAAASEELMRKGSLSSRTRSQNDIEIKMIIEDIKRVLDRIEDAVPLMNLAITTSGASLSTTLPSTVSPSRLLQASTFLTAADTQYSISPVQAVQVGPTFTLSMYMLFAGHVRPQDEEGIRETTWKEVMHKAKVKLRRVPMDLAFGPVEGGGPRPQVPAEARVDEFAYQILIIEDLDDGRVHTFDEGELQPGPFDGVETAGIREILPIHQISKIFYADTGKILNISTEGETNNPVLLLKRDINAIPPRRMLERTEAEYYEEAEGEEETSTTDEQDEVQALLDAQLNGASEGPEHVDYPSFHESSIPEGWRLPPGLDPEWVAFEVYNEEEDSETESETEESSSPHRTSRSTSVDPHLISRLNLSHSRSPSSTSNNNQVSSSSPHAGTTTVSNPLFDNIRTSLSLLETLLRLTSLQQFQQQSHLSITDELLNFFLEESSTTGAGGDETHRQRVRAEARRKVGWDPYDESPLKRRGEDYQYGWAPSGGSSTPGRYPQDSDDFPYSPNYEETEYHVRSREGTPESPLPPRSSPRPPVPERRRPSILRNPRTYADDPTRIRSPLSRPPTAPQTDEGLGTSPGSAHVK
ncbi:Ran-specific GTPase-activating protein 30 [Paecilomyces lecythidis]|uniref:Ran-specific GTPase-activating protein 30 n=1 Tax=Paecilomyces lecythidis TaxID=3004212 RepID=A0ABR3Y2V5_9EURO